MTHRMTAIVAMVLMGAGMALAQAEAPAPAPEDVKPPRIPSEILPLVAAEADIKAEMQAQSTELFKVLKDLRETRQRMMKQDKELAAMTREIALLQEKIDETMLEKYPEMKALDERRDTMMQAHDALREKLIGVRTRREEVSAALEAKKTEEPIDTKDQE